MKIQLKINTNLINIIEMIAYIEIITLVLIKLLILELSNSIRSLNK